MGIGCTVESKPLVLGKATALPTKSSNTATEAALQAVWYGLHFARNNLQTTCGKALEILSPGVLNTYGGPDFHQAVLRINGNLVQGSVELHLQPESWFSHQHHTNAHYANVVLHVVLHDGNLKPALPTLVLSKYLQNVNWHSLQLPKPRLPCSHLLSQTPPAELLPYLQNALLVRIGQRVSYLQSLLNTLPFQQAVWVFFMHWWGHPKHAEAYTQLAKGINIQALLALHLSETDMQAFLLWFAGLGNKPTCLPKNLLNKTPMPLGAWFLAKARGQNKPVNRLMQLAALLTQVGNPAIWLMQTAEAYIANKHFNLPYYLPKSRWQHLLLNVWPALHTHKKIGKQQTKEQISNTIFGVLQTLPFESNHITHQFALGKGHKKHAALSQGLLGYYQQNCKQGKCLSCPVWENRRKV